VCTSWIQVITRDCYYCSVPLLNCVLACALSATHKNLKIARQSVSRESVESHRFLINYSPVPLFLPLPFGIVISLRARKSANFIQEMITFTSRQQTRAREGRGRDPRRPGYKSAISVFRTLDLASGNRPTVAGKCRPISTRSFEHHVDGNHIETSDMRASCKDPPS